MGSFWTYILVEAYRGLFDPAGGGEPLPLATASLLRVSPVVAGLLPLLVLAAWWLWPDRTRRGLAALIVGAAIMIAVPQLVSTVMSLPILDLRPRP